MVISVSGDADNLLPPLTSNATSGQVGALVFDRLADLGDDLNTVGDEGFTPRLARSWRWAPDSLSIAFAIDPRARWHDGRPVRAADVRFTYGVYVDSTVGSVVRPLLANIDSVTVRDSLTAVFWFAHREPEQFFTAAYQMWILPEHLLGKLPRSELRTAEFARHPVGSGPYRFVGWTPSQAITVEADTSYYRGRPHLDRVIWSVAQDPSATFTRLASGEADFTEFLRPPDIQQLPKYPQLKAVEYPGAAQVFFEFNLIDAQHPTRANPLFGDRSVRRALAMAIDRPRLVQSIFDTLAYVSRGPVTRATWTFDPTVPQIPYAPDSARRLLAAAGWRDANGDGVLERGGTPFRFAIVVPTSSSVRMRMAVLLQDMLKQVGVRVDIDQQDFPTFLQRLHDHRFDAALNGGGMDPSPATIRQLWSASAARDGDNTGGYANPAFDAIVDSAATERDPARAKAIWRRAYATIVADAPAVWIYDLRMFAGMHRRIHTTRLRPEWWTTIPGWYIPSGERTPRDNVGLAAAPR